MEWLINNINDIKNPKKVIDMGKIRTNSLNLDTKDIHK